jgi:hypothetical protein
MIKDLRENPANLALLPVLTYTVSCLYLAWYLSRMSKCINLAPMHLAPMWKPGILPPGASAWNL